MALPSVEPRYSRILVRVAVIDSGVNARHPHISRLAGGVSIGADGSIDANDYTDTLGHGTAVTAAIQERAPDADYFAVRLFHDSLRASTGHLLRALEWAIDQGMDVINLSLGTRNPAHAPSLSTLVARAVDRGVLIVAAREAGGQLCYPGCLPGVINVGLDWDCPREGFFHRQGIFYASGYPRSLPGVPRERNLNGISFAVANMTGFVLRARGRVGGAGVREYLIAEALTSPAP